MLALVLNVEESVSFIPKPETAESPVATVEATNAELREGVEAAIEAIRPALQMDGGDITLLDVDEASGVVQIELIGACVGCPASTMTLKAGIERILKDRVSGVTDVVAVGLDDAAFDF